MSDSIDCSEQDEYGTSTSNSSVTCTVETYTESDKTKKRLIISGTGNMRNFWSISWSDINSSRIENGVTNIGSGTFYYCSYLTEVSISSTVTKIGSTAFSYCRSLTELTIPGSVITIQTQAFWECTGFTEFSIPDGVKTLGDEVFAHCSNLHSVDLPNSIESYGTGLFRSCSSLINITIPDNFETINNQTFSDCTNLTDVFFEGNVLTIMSKAFSNCIKLAEISLPESLQLLGQEAFYDCSSLYSIIIPDSVASIEAKVFSGCISLKNITIGNGLSSISSSVIYGTSSCSNLTEIIVAEDNSNFQSIDGVLYSKPIKTIYIYPPAKLDEDYEIEPGVETIVDNVFYKCLNLKNVTVPDSVTTLGMHVFQECSLLSNLTLPDGITSIGEMSFYKCSSLLYVNIPDELTSIEEKMFYCCYLINDLVLPDGLTVIKEYAFYYCKNLFYINLPDSITSIEGLAFDGCQSLRDIQIPPQLTSLSSYVFRDCSNITNITIPYGLVTIGSQAFQGCTKLKYVTIPDSVTTISQDAFHNTGIESLVIPDSVQQLSEAFSYMAELKYLTLGNGFTYLSSYSFSSCPKLQCVIYTGEFKEDFPDNTVEAFSKVTVHVTQRYLQQSTKFFGANVQGDAAEQLAEGKCDALCDQLNGYRPTDNGCEQCEQYSSTPYLSEDGTECVATCGSNSMHTDHVCVECPDNSYLKASSNECICLSPTPYLNADKTRCVSECESGTILTHTKTSCMYERDCASNSNGNYYYYEVDETRGICRCKTYVDQESNCVTSISSGDNKNKLTKEDGMVYLVDSCPDGTYLSDYYMTYDRPCISYLSCLYMRGIEDPDQPNHCICGESFPYYNEQTKMCENPCQNTILNPLENKCQSYCSSINYVQYGVDYSLSQCINETECQASNGVLSDLYIYSSNFHYSGYGCLCDSSHPYLNPEKTECIEECSASSTPPLFADSYNKCHIGCSSDLDLDTLLDLNENACINAETCTSKKGVVATITKEDIQTTANSYEQSSLYYNYNYKACICQDPNPFLSLDQDECVSSCGTNKIDLEGTKCISSCGYAQEEISTTAGAKCQCQEGYYLNLDGNACVNTCEDVGFINSAGTQCITICPSGETLDITRKQCLSECTNNSVPIILGDKNTYQITVCTCDNPLYPYLSEDGTECLSECLEGQIFAVNGIQCVSSCKEGQHISVDGTRCVNSCEDYNAIEGANNQCECSSASNPYINIGLDGNHCVSQCIHGEYNETTNQCQCPSDFPYLGPDKDVCFETCPSNFFVNEDTKECLYECRRNEFQSGARNCVDDCTKHNAMNNITSKQCTCGSTHPYNFNGECSLDCPSGYYHFSNGTCVSECPTNYYINSDYECIYEYEKSCRIGTDYRFPLSSACVCMPGTYYMDSSDDHQICVYNCPPGTYTDLSRKKCVTSCDSTMEEIDGFCQCPEGKVPTANYKHCVEPINCPTGTHLNLKKDQCVSQCDFANSTIVNDKNECECKSGLILSQTQYYCISSEDCTQTHGEVIDSKCVCPSNLPYSLFDSLECISKCPEDEPILTQDGLCIVEGMKQYFYSPTVGVIYDETNKQLKCDSDNYWTLSNTTVRYSSVDFPFCVLNCPSGKYQNLLGSQCVDYCDSASSGNDETRRCECPENYHITYYFSGYNPSSGYCNECYYSGQTYNYSSQQCLCPDGQGVVWINSNGRCGVCPEGYYLNYDTCYQCSDGYGSLEGATECSPCSELGKYVNINGSCVSECPSNTVLVDGACQCAFGYQYESYYKECRSCADNNKITEINGTCSSNQECSDTNAVLVNQMCECNPGYINLGGLCTPCSSIDASKPYIDIDGSCVAATECSENSKLIGNECVCTSPYPYLSYDKTKCVSECASGTYLSYDKYHCVQESQCGDQYARAPSENGICKCQGTVDQNYKCWSGSDYPGGKYGFTKEDGNTYLVDECPIGTFRSNFTQKCLTMAECLSHRGTVDPSEPDVCQCPDDFPYYNSRTGMCENSCSTDTVLTTSNTCSYSCYTEQSTEGSYSDEYIFDYSFTKCISKADCSQSNGNYSNGYSCNCTDSFLNVEQTQCVASCSSDVGYPVFADSRNRCRKGCSQESNTYLNLKEDACITWEACQQMNGQSKTIENTGYENKYSTYQYTSLICTCAYTNYPFVNVDKDRCVSNCGDDFISLDNSTCLTQCGENEEAKEITIVIGGSTSSDGSDDFSGSGGTYEATEITQKKCQCQNGKYMTIEGDRCVSSCEGIGFINSAGTQCVEKCDSDEIIDTTMKRCLKECGNHSVATSVTYDYSKQYQVCTCAHPLYPYLSEDGTECISQCPEGQILAIGSYQCTSNCEEGQSISIDGTKCVDSCQDFNAVEGTGNRCECSGGTHISLDGQSCVTDCLHSEYNSTENRCQCPSDSEYLGPDKDRCFESCSSGLYVNEDEKQCLYDCGNLLVKYGTDECTSCEEGYISPSSQQCVTDCNDLRATLGSDSKSCTCGGQYPYMYEDFCYEACPYNYFHFANGTCVKQCPSGYIIDVNNECIYQSCSITDNNFLNGQYCVCEPGRYLTEDYKCVNVCPLGTYADLSRKKCVTDCGSNVQANDAFCECPAGTVPTANYKACVEPTNCPTGSHLNLKKDQCVINCDSENSTIVNDNNECECKSGLILAQSEQFCFSQSTCEDEKNGVVSGSKCVCPESRKYHTTDQLVCTSDCPDDYFMALNETCASKNYLSIYQNFAGRYYDYSSSYTTFRCDTDNNWQLSTYHVEYPLYYFPLCIFSCQGTTYLDITQNSCIEQCGTNQIANETTRKCECKEGLTYSSERSQCSCPAGQYIDSNEQCTPCPAGTYEYYGNCYSCNTNYWSNPGSTRCYTCPELGQFTGFDGSCVDHCPEHSTTIQGKCVCPSPYQYLNSDGTECVTDCGSGTYLYYDKLHCVTEEQCNGDYSAYTENGICMCRGFVNMTYSCTDNTEWYYSYTKEDGNRYLVSQCPNGTYADYSTRTCTSSSDCSLLGKLTDLDGKCVDYCSDSNATIINGICMCPAGYTISDSNTCVECSSIDSDKPYTSINGTCVAASECPPSSTLIGNECVCSSPNPYLNLDRTECVSECEKGSYLSFDKYHCVTKAQCGHQYNIYVDNGMCMCHSYITRNNTCSEYYCDEQDPTSIDGHLIKKNDGNRYIVDHCPDDTYTSNYSVYCLTLDKCYSHRGIVDPSNSTRCICPSTFPYYNLQTQMCENECSTGYLFLPNKVCQNYCPDYNNQGYVVDFSQKKCITREECVQKNGNYENSYQFCTCSSSTAPYLNINETQCITNCSADSSGYPAFADSNNHCRQGCSSDGSADSLLNLKGNSCITAAQCTAANGQPATISQVANYLSSYSGYYSTNYTYEYQACICGSQTYLNLDQTACVSSCGNNFINLYGNQCVSSCKTGEEGVQGTNGKRCKCKAGYYLNEEGDACIKSCEAIGYINEDGTQCVKICPSNQYLDLPRKQCRSQCEANSVSNTIGSYYYSINVCVCDHPSYPYLSEDSTQCLSECPNGQLLAAGSNQCTSKCQSNQYISIDGTKCVISCGSNAVANRQNRCQCQAGSHISLDGESCVTECLQSELNTATNRCQCPSSAPYLGPDKDKCFGSCPSGLFVYEENKQCLYECGKLFQEYNSTHCTKCENNLFSLDSEYCIKDCSSIYATYDPDSQKCVCGGDYPYSYYTTCLQECPYYDIYHDANGTCTDSCPHYVNAYNLCIDTCPEYDPVSNPYVFPFESEERECICSPGTYQIPSGECVFRCPTGTYVDLSHKKCVSSCGPNTVVSNGYCQCAAGTVPKANYNGCVSPSECPDESYLSLNQDHCVTECTSNYYSNTTIHSNACHCTEGTYLSLGGLDCASPSRCAELNGEIVNSKCQCKEGYPYITIDYYGQLSCSSSCESGIITLDNWCVSSTIFENLPYRNVGILLNEETHRISCDATNHWEESDKSTLLWRLTFSYCEINCPTGSYKSIFGNSCVSKCGDYEDPNDYTKQCECWSGTSIQNPANKSLIKCYPDPCPIPTQIYDNVSRRCACPDGHEEYNGECVLCQDGWIGAHGICDLRCPSGNTNANHTECLEKTPTASTGRGTPHATRPTPSQSAISEIPEKTWALRSKGGKFQYLPDATIPASQTVMGQTWPTQTISSTHSRSPTASTGKGTAKRSSYMPTASHWGEHPKPTPTVSISFQYEASATDLPSKTKIRATWPTQSPSVLVTNSRFGEIPKSTSFTPTASHWGEFPKPTPTASISFQNEPRPTRSPTEIPTPSVSNPPTDYKIATFVLSLTDFPMSSRALVETVSVSTTFTVMNSFSLSATEVEENIKRALNGRKLQAISYSYVQTVVAQYVETLIHGESYSYISIYQPSYVLVPVITYIPQPTLISQAKNEQVVNSISVIKSISVQKIIMSSLTVKESSTVVLSQMVSSSIEYLSSGNTIISRMVQKVIETEVYSIAYAQIPHFYVSETQHEFVEYTVVKKVEYIKEINVTLLLIVTTIISFLIFLVAAGFLLYLRKLERDKELDFDEEEEEDEQIINTLGKLINADDHKKTLTLMNNEDATWI